MSPSPVEELALLDLDRSNKGASKQRRDQINAEIARMRDLLPLPETARQRLSQLQIMSLSCVFIRKCNVLQKLFRSFPAEKDSPLSCDFFQALTGFLLITTREGKLVYISENVTDYLGHSMVDMKTQGDSLYDIVDKRDHGTVQAQLLQGGADLDVTQDVAFFCRMNMSRTLKRQAGFGDVKVMHVRGHFIPLSDLDTDGSDQQQQHQPQKYVFMATCSPLITPELKENLVQSNTMVFKTVHQLDMSFLEVTKTAEYYLGYTTEEICQKSWYSMVHPEDIHEAREKHILLIRSSHEMGCMMTVRMLSAEGQVLWVNIVLHVRQAASTQNDDPLIVCINQVISEEEACQIRMQSHMFAMYPPRSADMWTAGLNTPHSGSMPQHSQPDTSPRWMPTSTVVAAPSHSGGSGYHQGPPVNTYYVSGQQRHALPTSTVDYTSMHDAKDYHINNASSSSPPSTMPLPQGQTDKLKLMLKRKIQGPCRPAKVPKLAWDEQADGSGNRQGFEYAATADAMHSPDSASQFLNSGNTSNVYSWPASTQVVPRSQYRIAHVLPVVMNHQSNVKAHLLSSPCPSALSPPMSSQLSEQVVPESSVAVPDSFLTPDPSPASSPHPHSSSTNGASVESTETKIAPTSAAILQELEKLAAFCPSQTSPAAVAAPQTARPLALQHVKTEKTSLPQCQHASRQRELPIIDAFDIESFFDTLNCCDQKMIQSGEENKREGKIVPQVPEVAKEMPARKSVDISKQPLIIKQEPVDMEKNLPLDNLQIPSTLPAKSPLPQQPEVNPTELEELLNFFSDDMTASQLDLGDTLLASSPVKEDADMLIESLKAFANNYGQGSLACDAGHLNHFLLQSDGYQRPLEEFSPVSSADMSSDVNSELSGDEESSGEERLEALLLPAVDRLAGYRGQQIKRERGERQRPAPSFTGPSPGPTQSHKCQDVPGIPEEDELYQLDKLLSSMASDNGMTVSGETQ